MDGPVTAAVAPRLFNSTGKLPIVVRRVELGDAVQIVDLLYRLSERTRRLRYFSARPFSAQTAWAEAERIVRGHAGDRLALVATAPQAAFDEIFAVAELVPEARDPAVATLAIVVRDDFQRQGIGRALAGQLVQCARRAGLAALRADLLAENRAIRRLIDRLGVPYTTTTSYGEMTATLRLSADAGRSVSPHAIEGRAAPLPRLACENM
jgi:GNAT superfamily N-acetyltransferase